MAFRGIITRAQWGAIPPARPVGTASFRKGAGIHHGGPPPAIRSHDDCYTTVRAYQKFHIRDRGWADIAYSFLPCQHGYAFEGRGWWGRVAAHDDGNPADGNENTDYRAFCWLGGAGQEPTTDAIDAFRALVAEGRRLGAGAAIEPHTRLQPGHTECPGRPLVLAIDRGDLEPRTSTAPTPALQTPARRPVMLFARKADEPHVYVSNGVRRRHVTTPKALGILQEVAAIGLTGAARSAAVAVQVVKDEAEMVALAGPIDVQPTAPPPLDVAELVGRLAAVVGDRDPIDVDDLAERLAAALPDDVAKRVADVIADRLQS